MNLNLIKHLAFDNKIISEIQRFIPNRFLFTKEYDEIIKLNKLFASGASSDLNELLKKRLSIILKNAFKNVPYYKSNYKIRPDSITNSNAHEILLSLPYLDKKTVMKEPKQFISLKDNLPNLQYSTSGGSTGEGVAVYRNFREISIERAFYDYEFSKIGFNYLKSKYVKFGVDGRKKSDEEPCEIKGHRLLVSPYHLNSKWIVNIFNRIKLFNPEFFFAYPSCLEYLARFMVQNNLFIQVKGVVLASEIMTKDQYELFKDLFNCPIISTYGLSEHSNLAFSILEDDRINYRLNPVYSYSENLVNEYGFYEIIGTSYWITSMPLIRYKTQDFGRIVDNTIVGIDGRNQEFLITNVGNKIPGLSIKIDEFVWDYVEYFQVFQEKKGELIIKLVPKLNCSSEVIQKILSAQQERWGDYFFIKAQLVEEIEKTKNGKYRLVVNKIE